MFFGFSVFLLAVLALNFEQVHGTNQHMICKTVGDVFTDGESSQASTRPRVLRGPPGKKGQSGVKGEPGLPGVVDPQSIQDAVEEKFSTVTRDLEERIGNLEKRFEELNSTSNESPQDDPVDRVIPCDDGFIYSRKCYYVISHGTADVPYSEAPGLCHQSTGKLADIVNGEHQVLVNMYIRPKMSSPTNLYVWTAMKYNLSRKTLRWSNGDKISDDVAASFHWHTGYPTSTSSYEAVGIDTEKDITDDGQGLFNYSPTQTTYGVLCER